MYDLTLPDEKSCSWLVMEPPADDAVRFTNPLSDFGFKRIFGNTQIMAGFLGALFEGEIEVPEVTFNSQEIPGPVSEARTVIVDLACTGKNGEQFIVEMQRANVGNVSNRTVFYNCRSISEQLLSGKESNGYAIRETYSIAVLDFILPGSPPDTYMHDACTYYRGSDALFSNKQRYKIIELPKFVKTIDEVTSEADKWIYFTKHLRAMQEVHPVFLQDALRKAIDIAEISNFPLEVYKMYRSSLEIEHDYEMALAYAKQEAAEEERQTVAKTLIRDTDFDDEKIAALTGVGESFVRQARSA